MDLKRRSSKTEADKMTIRTYKRVKENHQFSGSRNPLTWKLFLFLMSIPAVALYIGYAIGNYLMPPPRKFPDKGVVVDIGRLNYSWYNTHNVTIDFAGGLGNQMFQYAAMYGIAKANGLKPQITTNNRLLDIFPGIKAGVVIDERTLRGYSNYHEFNPSAFDGRTFSLNFMKNVKLSGYFQSWRYFDHIRADVRRQFTFRSEVRQKVNSAIKDIYKVYTENADPEALKDPKKPVQFVGIHIRRGDTLESSNLDKGYTVADEMFIHRAIQYYEVIYRNVVFIVCTDDEEWARSYARTSSKSSLVVLSPFLNEHPIYDLCMLAMCNHTVVTVGTFGWWGAWLAGGDVVYYKNYPRPFSELSRHFSHADYFITQWVPM